MFVKPHDVPPLFCFDVQTDMCFLLLQLMSPEGRRCKKFDVRSCCNKKSHVSLHVKAKRRGHIVWFHKRANWHDIFLLQQLLTSNFLQRLPSGDMSCCNKITSVCTWKQNSGDAPCGFTNIKSNWNISRSDEKCSPVHKYWLNQSLKHQMERVVFFPRWANWLLSMSLCTKIGTRHYICGISMGCGSPNKWPYESSVTLGD